MDVNMNMRIELGCGPHHNPAYFGIDAVNLPGVDMVWDLENVPLPLPDECCIEITSSHLMEHIKNFIPLVNECHRLLKPGGIFTARFPQVCDINGRWHQEGFQDPTHVRFFVPNSWMYFVSNHHLSHFGKIYGIKVWEGLTLEDFGAEAKITLRKIAEPK
jgi:SAM-dependent methyltransferase